MIWKELNKNAYVPYSGVPRSCIVEGSGGGFYAGVRIEIISFPITIGAIQAACCICLSEGETPVRIIVPDRNFSQLNFWINEFDCELSVGVDPSSLTIRNLKKTSIPDEANRLKEMLASAVIPNSDFPVSAIVKSGGYFFEGVNIEVSDWGLGLCAERIALAKAASHGFYAHDYISIHTKKGEFSSPCGACRQVLHEFMPLKPVKLHHANQSYSEHFVLDLLPFSFTSIDLHK